MQYPGQVIIHKKAEKTAENKKKRYKKECYLCPYA
jgi:hypothetical protein